MHDQVIIELPNTKGKHSNITSSLIEQLLIVIRQIGKGGLGTIPRESIVKLQREKSGYEPDIIALNQEVIEAESH